MPKVRIRPDCENSSAGERQQRRAVRQHARRPTTRTAKRTASALAVALAQADADCRHHLHAVGKAHHHDERRHDVEEQVELEAEPAEQAQRPQHGQHGRQRRSSISDTRLKKIMATVAPNRRPRPL